jgi:hypothetical protein
MLIDGFSYSSPTKQQTTNDSLPQIPGVELTKAFQITMKQLMQMWKVGETSSPSINGKPGKDKRRGDCQCFLTKIASVRRLHGQSAQRLHEQPDREAPQRQALNSGRDRVSDI